MGFFADDARLGLMHGYEPCGQVNQWTRGAHNAEMLGATPRPATIAFARAFRAVRREIWDAREARLRPGKDWPSYG